MRSRRLPHRPFLADSPRARGPVLALSPPAPSLPCARAAEEARGAPGRCAIGAARLGRVTAPSVDSGAARRDPPSGRPAAGPPRFAPASTLLHHVAPPPSPAGRAIVGAPPHLGFPSSSPPSPPDPSRPASSAPSAAAPPPKSRSAPSWSGSTCWRRRPAATPPPRWNREGSAGGPLPPFLLCPC